MAVGRMWGRDANMDPNVSPDPSSLPRLIATADEGRADGVLDLAQYLLQLTADDRVNADDTLRLLGAIGPRTWIRLDADLRSWSRGRAAEEHWRRITDAAWRGSDPLAVLVTACSGNGYVRQGSVADPVMSHDRRLLPVLMIRTADWVEQVRVAARKALTEMLDAPDTSGVAAAVGVAAAMRDWLRGDFAVAALSRALRAAPDALAAALASADVQTRRLAYQVWLEAAPGDDLIDAALRETDIICVTLCANAVVDHAVRIRRPAVLDRLLTARSVRARIAALTGLVRLDRPAAGRAFLIDHSAMMRATAQWAVRRSGQDPAKAYRAMPAAELPAPQARGLVAGLGECGGPGDVDRIASFLGHPRPRVRAEAVRALRRLGPGDALHEVKALLTDPAPVVVRAVSAVLRSRPEAVPAGRLWELLAADRPRHVRIGAFDLLVARDAWTRIEADLKLITADDDQLRTRARGDLAAWLDRDAATTYATPPARARDRLHALIGKAEPTLGAHTARTLRWHLGK